MDAEGKDRRDGLLRNARGGGSSGLWGNRAEGGRVSQASRWVPVVRTLWYSNDELLFLAIGAGLEEFWTASPFETEYVLVTLVLDGPERPSVRRQGSPSFYIRSEVPTSTEYEVGGAQAGGVAATGGGVDSSLWQHGARPQQRSGGGRAG